MGGLVNSYQSSVVTEIFILYMPCEQEFYCLQGFFVVKFFWKIILISREYFGCFCVVYRMWGGNGEDRCVAFPSALERLGETALLRCFRLAMPQSSWYIIFEKAFKNEA